MAERDIATAIQAALERDADVNLHRFPIEITREGEACRLAGKVENIIAKRKALQIAHQHAGDVPIIDALRVQSSRHREDQELTQLVERTLAEEPVFRDFAIRAGDRYPSDEQNWITVNAKDGTVRLDGQVYSLSHRRMAEVLTWWIAGCENVDNRLRVEPPERDTDAEITDAVRLILDKESSIDSSQVHARTKQQEVYLEGTVRSEDNKRIAGYDCWYIPGVHAVHNHLEVRPNSISS